MTKRLFYDDSHMREFEAHVLSCQPVGEKYEVVLDRTAFFPEGGGQAADTGSLGNVRVLDVREEGEQIIHLTDGELWAGAQVSGRIDWETRFSRMQQHTGEHIVSGLIHGRFGYDNVGFHLGEEVCTLDLSGPITKEELAEIELAANQVVFANLPVEVTYPSREELEALDYRSKIEIEGQVRIVTIPGVDVCACCAPHVSHTGEIGLVKFIHMQNYKGGVRITMVCGLRALMDYRAKEESVKAIMQSLSSKEEKIAEAVEHLKEEVAEQKRRGVSLLHEVFLCKVKEIPENTRKVCLFEDDLDGGALRELMNLALSRGVGICGVFTGNDAEGYRYVLGSKTEDVRPFGKALNEAFAGRGGGKPEMVQGSLKGKEAEIRSHFS
ncbi:alanyl-tRNA editing protein [Roseburia hominis]